MSEPLVALRDVSLGYGRRVVLQNIDLVLEEGDFLGIVGPNGSGKSTLLKGMLGLIAPRRGEISCRGGRRAVRFGYVPQREMVDSVFPITALELVMMSRATLSGPLRSPGKAGRAKALEALGSVGLDDLAGRRFRDLSGGQQQRVLIARALALEPRVLLLDEPTNGMDLGSEHALMELVARLHQHERLTVVMVSHVLNVVVNYARSLVLIEPSAFLAGPIDQVLTVANLERVYGTGVSIGTVGGRRVVLPSQRSHTS